MSTRTLSRLVLATAFAALGSAHAAEADLDYPWHDAPFVQASGGVQRADVIAAALAARAAGQLDVGEAGAMPPIAVGAKTRAQVIAELQEARRHGLVGHGESNAPMASAEQLRRIADAGLRARGADTALAQRMR